MREILGSRLSRAWRTRNQRTLGIKTVAAGSGFRRMKAAPPELASSKSTRSLATAFASLIDNHRGLFAPPERSAFQNLPVLLSSTNLIRDTWCVMRDA
jgi:hypothetical protein